MFRSLKRSILFASCILFTIVAGVNGQNAFRVRPYLQNPAPNAMTIMWLSETDESGQLSFSLANSDDVIHIQSTPTKSDALAYTEWESEIYFDGNSPFAPYLHRVRLTELLPATTYNYQVIQSQDTFSATFRTAPDTFRKIRFMVFADSETEPESTGSRKSWPDPVTGEDRDYLIDQTVGFANNLAVMQSRKPDLLIIAGDLVQSGNEQRDWDEFWRQMTTPENSLGLASEIPILAALGNHEYYAGPKLGCYDQPFSEQAVQRFQTYFEFPENGSDDDEHQDRFYRLDYGPVAIIVLDVANNSVNGSTEDTNFYLLGESDVDGGHAPDFTPESYQYRWLETQLADAQLNSAFTFVTLHHAPYSVGPHGLPVGDCDVCDDQSGRPVRTLTPLFMKYGVDAVFSGHDEMYERSEMTGVEMLPDQSQRSHTIHFYDIGIGGDGLRGPEPELENPYQKFLAHTDAPEVWEDDSLVDGGKHYGHLEVNVTPLGNGAWQATLTPVYVFPLFDSDGKYSGFERRTYQDEISIISALPTQIIPVELASFSGRVVEKGIELRWNTQTESGNYGFEILRKTSAGDWKQIGFVNGHGTTTEPHRYNFIDSNIEKRNEYSYRLRQIDTDGTYHDSKPIKIIITTAESFYLSPNYPNPFNASTVCSYHIPYNCDVRINVFNINGKKIKTLVNGFQNAGDALISWDGRNGLHASVASGLYWIQMSAGPFTTSHKLVLLK